jgi:hypothetical protein
LHLSTLMLQDFPDEAAMAYNMVDAVWKYHPVFDSDVAYAQYDDDTKRYARVYVQHGWRVSHRIVEHEVALTDSDGDFEGDCCSVDDPLYEGFLAGYDFRACEQSWTGYYEYVIKTKNDYLNEFYTQDPIKLRKDAKKALWRALKQQREDTRDLTRARVLCDPDGLVHWAAYNRSHLWRTLCGHFFPDERRTDSELLTCLGCLAEK